MSRANKKKPGMPNVANDLSQKLYASLEKHKEVSACYFCREFPSWNPPAALLFRQPYPEPWSGFCQGLYCYSLPEKLSL